MISFWLVTLGVPLLVVVGNSLVRFMKGLAQSAAADLLLALTVFNFAVVVEYNKFQEYIRITQIRSDIVAIYCLLVIISVACWFISVFHIEEHISSYWFQRTVSSCPDPCPLKHNPPARFPTFRYFFILFIPSINLFASLSPFMMS